MISNFYQAAAGLVLSIAASQCMAGELYRLTVDFQGKGKTETVHVSTSPTKEEGTRTFTVKIGSSTFTREYNSSLGDEPHVSVIGADDVRKQRLLMIDMPEACCTNNYVLGYASKAIVPLLELEDQIGAKTPVFTANGTISIEVWNGFWYINNVYHRTGKDQRFELVAQPSHFVRVGGAAAAGLTLDGAECKAMTLAENTFVKVVSFEPKLNRYRLESANGGCGWVPADKLEERVKELPLAG
jgi:hypothetical protein